MKSRCDEIHRERVKSCGTGVRGEEEGHRACDHADRCDIGTAVDDECHKQGQCDKESECDGI